MYWGQSLKKTFTVLTGLSLLFLLAFYGFSAKESTAYESSANHVRDENTGKVAHFSIGHKQNARKHNSHVDVVTQMQTSKKATLNNDGEDFQAGIRPNFPSSPTSDRIKQDSKPRENVKNAIQAQTVIRIQPDMSTTTTMFGIDTTTATTLSSSEEATTASSMTKSTTDFDDDDDDDDDDIMVKEKLAKYDSKHPSTLGKTDSQPNPKPKVTNFTEVENRFSARIQRYNEICKKNDYRTIKPTNYIRSVRSTFANNRLRWCQIPKIATTFLKYIRRENKPAVDKQGLTRYRGSRRKSFFLVREPYSRLVSGFLCKIVTTPEFWRRYGLNIIRDYRPDASVESKQCGHDVTFPEFVKYFIQAQKSGLNKNKHFMPIHEQCSICKEKYDYIGHLETLIPDMTFIFDSVDVKMAVDIRDTEKEIISKSTSMMTASSRTQNCNFPCLFLRTLWWSFQARGFLSTDDAFPFGEEDCKNVSLESFTEVAINAYKRFTDKAKRSKQKRDIMVKLYLQVPLADRLKLKEILWRDFELFEYDPEPRDVFPELFNKQ